MRRRLRCRSRPALPSVLFNVVTVSGTKKRGKKKKGLISLRRGKEVLNHTRPSVTCVISGAKTGGPSAESPRSSAASLPSWRACWDSAAGPPSLVGGPAHFHNSPQQAADARAFRLHGLSVQIIIAIKKCEQSRLARFFFYIDRFIRLDLSGSSTVEE